MSDGSVADGSHATTTDSTRGSDLLTVQDAHASYGSVGILHGISMSVPRGARVALLGTNGAGKSTLLKVIAGVLPATKGSIHLDDREITRSTPAQRVGDGLWLMSGANATFPTLTVRDNLRMGGYRHLRSRQELEQRLDHAVSIFPALKPLLGRKAGVLSGGERQLVGLGRALVARPQLLMIDELSLGLAPKAVEALIPAVERMSDEGMTIVIVEQSLNIARRLTSHCYFLEKGAVRFDGPTSELVERGDIARAVFFSADK
jgi:ABC-type branched-subunit amino acid transport system ATPase component